jgi:ADP-heptose:LPS heptosyltransferase
MDKPKKILVTRFSALGDVAMTIPSIQLFLDQNKQVEVIYVSRPNFASLFEGIERLSFVPIDLEGKHKGILGLFKLFIALKKHKIDAYADLHNVLRTHILQFFFMFSGISIKKIDKGRSEKKALTRKNNKTKIQLKSTTERYLDVFRDLGFTIIIPAKKTFEIRNQSKIIGVAPFAQHKAKIYPPEFMQQIVLHFAHKNFEIILLGSGKEEKEIFGKWTKLHKNISVLGVASLSEEIESMKKMSFMISMDSANMHLASLAQTAVFSVWGGTHFYAGFLGYRQNKEFIIDHNLDCRPCSVYGNKACFRKDYACLNQLQPKYIIEKIELVLSKTNQA